jgi:hypothetical protein
MWENVYWQLLLASSDDAFRPSTYILTEAREMNRRREGGRQEPLRTFGKHYSDTETVTKGGVADPSQLVHVLFAPLGRCNGVVFCPRLLDRAFPRVSLEVRHVVMNACVETSHMRTVFIRVGASMNGSLQSIACVFATGTLRGSYEMS